MNSCVTANFYHNWRVDTFLFYQIRYCHSRITKLISQDMIKYLRSSTHSTEFFFFQLILLSSGNEINTTRLDKSLRQLHIGTSRIVSFLSYSASRRGRCPTMRYVVHGPSWSTSRPRSLFNRNLYGIFNTGNFSLSARYSFYRVTACTDFSFIPWKNKI